MITLKIIFFSIEYNVPNKAIKEIIHTAYDKKQL